VPRVVACVLMLASVALAVAAPIAAQALVSETVTVDSGLASKGPFTAQLLRPPGPGPFAAIVAMHGCGGLLNDKGKLRAREMDWAERFVAAGYVVLFPDSFTARGVREICTSTTRSIFPKDRADDIAAAAEWLAGQPYVDKTRIALIGWSHGAMAVLWALRPGFLGTPPRFKTAIAFYPGCRQIARLEDWRPSVPLTLLIGGADDWTRPGPCRELARRTGFRFVEYIGAYHGFDAPTSRVRVRRGLGAVEGGHAHVGTDPAARDAAIKDVMDTLRTALGGP
jgi:dienelactone hydrolase